MKKLIALFLSLWLLSCSLNRNEKPMPESLHTKREKAIQKLQRDIEGRGVTLNLVGENKDILNIRSTTLKTYQITQFLRDDLQGFADAGFSEINIEDSNGEKQTINLIFK